MKPAFLIFDAIYLLASSVVYVSAGTLAYIAASPLSGEHPLSIMLSVGVGYFLFLHFFILLVARVLFMAAPCRKRLWCLSSRCARVSPTMPRPNT